MDMLDINIQPGMTESLPGWRRGIEKRPLGAAGYSEGRHEEQSQIYERSCNAYGAASFAVMIRDAGNRCFGMKIQEG